MKTVNKPLVIPVFIPHAGCPHQCAFCNQTILSSQSQGLPEIETMDQMVQEWLEYGKNRCQTELAFFGGNFLGLDHTAIQKVLDWAGAYLDEKKINAIRFSTRPDTITPETLDLVKGFPVSMVELGVQSMNDAVLDRSLRGHNSEDSRSAVALLKSRGIAAGVQVMLGMPGDTDDTLFDSTRQAALLRPEAARIYPLLVLRGSLLEKWHQKRVYEPLTLEKSVELARAMVEIFQSCNVKVIRIGLQASDIMNDSSMVVAGPWHPAFGHLVRSRMMYHQVCREIERLCTGGFQGHVLLKVHPNSVARLMGDRRENMGRLKERYPLIDFTVCQDESVPEDSVRAVPDQRPGR